MRALKPGQHGQHGQQPCADRSAGKNSVTPPANPNPLPDVNASRVPSAGSTCKYLFMGCSRGDQLGHAEFQVPLAFGACNISSYLHKQREQAITQRSLQTFQATPFSFFY
jgi:hypothetical protein